MLGDSLIKEASETWGSSLLFTVRASALVWGLKNCLTWGQLFKWSALLLSARVHVLRVRVWSPRTCVYERECKSSVCMCVGEREQEFCDTQRDNKGRDLAPRRPFISFFREVIPIDSYWTTSREALGGDSVWFVKGREDRTRPFSSLGHLLTKRHNNNQLPNDPSHLYPSVQLLIYHFISPSSLLPLNRSIVLPQSHLPLPHPSFALPSSFDCRTNAFVGEATIVEKLL